MPTIAVNWLALTSRAPSPRERPPSRVGDPHRRDFKRVPTGDHALGGRGREPGAHKLDHLRDGEAVREHHRFGRAVARAREKFKGAKSVRFGTAAGAAGCRHGALAADRGLCRTPAGHGVGR